MPMPPSDTTASDLWLKLQESPTPSEVVDFPRKVNGKPVGQLRIQVVDVDAHDLARLEAREKLKAKGVPVEEFSGENAREVLGDLTARELLCIACVSVDPIEGTGPDAVQESAKTPRYNRIFRTPEQLGKLTADELATLFRAWQLVTNKYGPYEGNIDTDEELNAWIKRLGEGASAFPLARCSLPDLVGLVMSLSERVYCLSVALECQLSTLPDTLKSDLEPWGIGTGYFGKRRAAATLPGLALKTSELDEAEEEGLARQKLADSGNEDPHPLDVPDPDEPITIEAAAKMAQEFHDKDR